jgi:hypothetical protein
MKPPQVAAVHGHPTSVDQPSRLSTPSAKYFGRGHHIRVQNMSAFQVVAVGRLTTFIPFWSMIYALLLDALCLQTLAIFIYPPVYRAFIH